MPNVGFLAHAATLAAEAARPGVADTRVAEIGRLIWNDRIDCAMTAFFIAVVAIVLLDSVRVWTRLILQFGWRDRRRSGRGMTRKGKLDWPHQRWRNSSAQSRPSFGGSTGGVWIQLHSRA